MEASRKNIYLISNANPDLHSENTLINFTNTLPFKIDVEMNEGIEVALSHLGISNNFKNIHTPESGLPSFFITNEIVPTHGLNEKNEIVDLPIKIEINTFDVDSTNVQKVEWYEYEFENKYYNLKDLKKFFKQVSDESQTDIQFTDDLTLEIKSKNELYSFWIFMHETMIKTFNFKNYDVTTRKEFVDDPNREVYKVETANSPTSTVLRKTYYKGELYYTYHISIPSLGNVNHFLYSEPSPNIFKKKFPNVIKVICENISPQIFNNTYSKDLIVFSPDFTTKEDYSWTEFGVKQYVPISNTSISDFKIKIVDENNDPIKLLEGPATLLKMSLRLRRPEKKTFNVRLTSAVTSEYPGNTNSIFKVKLPSPILINRNWRVALTSISNPNTFSTLIENPDTRTIQIRQVEPTKNKKIKLILPNDQNIYTKEELVRLINWELIDEEIGSAEVLDGKIVFTFTSDVLITCSNILLKILGYNGQLNEKKVYSRLFYTNKLDHELNNSNYVDKMNFVVKEDDSYKVSFINEMDMDYLKPNYMIVYSSIVSKSVIGGIMSNILKVVPIKWSNGESYAISDFKSKEYYELQNTEIDSIEINLRSHDGELINFSSSQDTILNLEFTNYLEMYGQ